MLPLSTRLKHVALGVMFALLLWLGILLARPWLPSIVAHGWEALDRFCYDTLFISTNSPADKLIIIDSLDPESKRSRAEYADLLARLFAANAQCVGLDIVFRDDKDSAATAQLAASSAQGCAIHPLSFYQSQGSSFVPERRNIEKFALRLAAMPDFGLAPQANGVETPCEPILAAARGAGHINFREQDWRYLPMWIHYEGALYPAFALELARQYLGVKAENFTLAQDLITLTTPQRVYEIPTDDHGMTLINFIHEDDFTKKFSWEAAFAKLQHTPDYFARALVLVVNSAAIDDPPEPWPPIGNGAYPHWAFHASVISQILNGATREESVFHNLWITLLLVAALLAWLLFGETSFPKIWFMPFVTLAALAGALAILAIVAQWMGQRLWLVLPGAVCSVTYLIMRYSHFRCTTTTSFVNFEVLVSHSQNKAYSVAVTAGPAGEAEAQCKAFQFDEKQSATLEQLKTHAAQRSEAMRLGAKLFEALFVDKIGLLYERALERVTTQKQKLRLKLRIDAPELRHLPWELLYDARFRYDFLGFSENVSITRHIPTLERNGLEKLRLPLKILVVVSSPSELPSLVNVEAEKAALKKVLRRLSFTRAIKLNFTKTATLDEIKRALKKGIHVLHYIGHSKFDANAREGFIALENEDGSVVWCDEQTLAETLGPAGLRLAVLNSCESAATAGGEGFVGLAPKLVQAGIPAVVAMQYKIPDDLAVDFAGAFYRAFLRQLSIDEAVCAGRRALMTRTTLAQQHWATPVLLMRSMEAMKFEAGD